jgi:hypothetical protein
VVEVTDRSALIEHVHDDGARRQQRRLDLLLLGVVSADGRDERARGHFAAVQERAT